MGFAIQVNGETVWETDEHASLISKVHVIGPAGEVGYYASTLDNTYLNLVLEMRPPSSLDMIQKAADDARRELDENPPVAPLEFETPEAEDNGGMVVAPLVVGPEKEEETPPSEMEF